MNIINVGYDSTNYYAIDIHTGKLLVDCGWPGTLPKLSAELKRKGSRLNDIKYLLVTHFHPDHAGLTQEIKNQGAKLILPDVQAKFVEALTDFFKTKTFPYVEITNTHNIQLKMEESRKFMVSLGLAGEIIHTPGHSDDSITLLLDEGYAFTGDLHPVFMVPEDDQLTRKSWDTINQHNIQKVFAGHG